MRELSLEEFEVVNEVELSCIFAESGADREMDFDVESEILKLYEDRSNGYNLVYTIEP
jgi:hypothetical protein